MSFLRQYISEVIVSEARSRPPGAGVVVVKRIDEEWKVLGLRLYGKYDIPKGGIEEGEDTFSTALRETLEEADISELNFRFLSFITF